MDSDIEKQVCLIGGSRSSFTPDAMEEEEVAAAADGEEFGDSLDDGRHEDMK